MERPSHRSLQVHKLLWGLLSGALGALASLALLLTGVLTPVERATYDWRVRRFPGQEVPDPPVALLLIDQRSLDFYARESGMGWPWRRDIYALMIEALRARGARAVGFDVLFTEPSESWPEDDEALGEATRGHGAVYHAFDARLETAGQTRREARDDLFGARRAIQVDLRAEVPWEEVNQFVLPIPLVEEGARGVGSVRFLPDSDGQARSVELLVRRRGRLFPSLPLAIAHDILGGGPVEVDEGPVLRVGGSRVRLDSRGRMLVRFLGPERTFPDFSVHLLIQDYIREQQGEPPDSNWEALDGAVVLVGSNFTDLKHTPHEKPMPGVEVHANVLAGLLTGESVVAPPGWLAPLVATLLALLAGATIVWSGRPALSTGAVLALGAAYLALAAGVFARRGLWLPVAVPLAAVVVALVAGSLASYALEGRQRRFLRRAFEHYLDPQVIETMVRDPSQLRLGGVRRELTIFFSDIRDFTRMSEGLRPEDLVQILNHYLSEMTKVVLARGGTLDKYTGDAIMAFWGAPVPVAGHARLACLAALENLERLRAITPALKSAGAGQLSIRIGLNTGPAVVGNMGSERVFNYTAMGDAVNLASRLEGLSKEYGTTILAGDATRSQAGGGFLWREIDLVRVKGREGVVRIHELLGREEEAGKEERELVAIQDRALELFRAGGFAGAARLWERALRLRPEDGPAGVMLERCAHYAKHPPPADWQGEHVMLHK